MNLDSFRDYLILEKRLSAHTSLAYLGDLSDFFSFCNSELQIANPDNVSYSVIRSWIVCLVEAGISNRTINRKLASLKAYYKFLLKIKQIEKTPFAKHVPLKVPKKLQLPFSLKEMNEGLCQDAFEDSDEGIRDRAIIELLYATGIRRAELLGLQVSSVDFSSQTIRVLGKRNKERMVPLTPHSVLVLKKYFMARERQHPTCLQLFLGSKGKKLSASALYRIVTTSMRKVSSKAKVSPHMLRHTVATHLLNGGANINDVKEILGHSSLVATQVYTHTSMDEIKRQYKRAHPRGNK